jgi:hypothetical protein
MSAAAATATAAATALAVIDPRLALLLRAAAKLELVDAGLEDLGDAFDDIEHSIHLISPCTCEREMVERWERWDRERRQQWRRR